MMNQWTWLVIALGLLAPGPALAESGSEQGHQAAGHAEHLNTLGVFLGVTSETRREGSFTLGLEYSRRIGEHYGVGAVLEHVFADHEFNVFAVSFARYVGPWKLYLAPGVEDSKDHDAEFLLRAGLEYAFQAGSMEIAPQFNVDFVDGDTVFVLGLTIGKGF